MGGGGAWKVAFADFMTAMMAFFLVMWLTSQDKEILIATSQYFQSPFKSPLTDKAGLLNFDSKNVTKSGGDGKKKDSQSGASTSSATAMDLQFLNSVAKEMYKMLNLDDALADKPLDVQVTSDGLKVTLYDRGKQPFFESGTAKFTKWGDFVMQSLAWTVERNKFNIVIEGHTRTGLVLPNPDYGAWELSADRANAARRALVKYAVDPAQIERVTGYANTRPVPLTPPDSETNQRVSMSLRIGKKPGEKSNFASQPIPTVKAAAPPESGHSPTAQPKH
ncbi:MAG: OmpA family protein [Opitutus sp.]|nr:OmpA family protein [Opitutus sp.]MCS6247999.1 OmpA family protein [Opitutus sp.]MCS6273375.1 OmpA family protein [Opitutus sp.]MCS6277441.1 OmpA family protein [Opitutus sp.]MCS6300558.1 OmpA family protein [Opitutus sp.]